MQPHIDSNNDRHKMWGVVLFCLVLSIPSGFGQSVTYSTEVENQTLSADKPKRDLDDVTGKLKVGSFLDEVADWASSAAEYVKEKSLSQTATLQPAEDGRRLKHKKTEIKFIMKTLILLKVLLSLILPLGIIASKILSWKAVTLSLMAFMLAKILFIKNLLTGKNALSVTPTNYVPPVLIHGGANDLFWKRQGDLQNYYPWTSS